MTKKTKLDGLELSDYEMKLLWECLEMTGRTAMAKLFRRKFCESCEGHPRGEIEGPCSGCGRRHQS